MPVQVTSDWDMVTADVEEIERVVALNRDELDRIFREFGRRDGVHRVHVSTERVCDVLGIEEGDVVGCGDERLEVGVIYGELDARDSESLRVRTVGEETGEWRCFKAMKLYSAWQSDKFQKAGGRR